MQRPGAPGMDHGVLDPALRGPRHALRERMGPRRDRAPARRHGQERAARGVAAEVQGVAPGLGRGVGLLSR
eukprot:8867569-Lingulodinium_polyedra.AAC.1